MENQINACSSSSSLFSPISSIFHSGVKFVKNVHHQIFNASSSNVEASTLSGRNQIENSLKPENLTATSPLSTSSETEEDSFDIPELTRDLLQSVKGFNLEDFKQQLNSLKNVSLDLFSAIKDTLKMFQSPFALDLALQFITQGGLFSPEYIFNTSGEIFAPVVATIFLTKLTWHIGKALLGQQPKKEILETLRSCFHSGLYLFLITHLGQTAFKNLLIKGHNTLTKWLGNICTSAMSATSAQVAQNTAPAASGIFSRLIGATKFCCTKAGSLMSKAFGKIIGVSYEKLIDSIYSKFAQTFTISYLYNLLKKESQAIFSNTKSMVASMFSSFTSGAISQSAKGLGVDVSETASEEQETSSTALQQASQTTDIPQPSENKNQPKIEILESPKAEPLSPKPIIVQDLVQDTDVSTQEGSSQDLIKTSDTIQPSRDHSSLALKDVAPKDSMKVGSHIYPQMVD